MADRVVTVRIGADASGLRTEIKRASAEVRTSAQQMQTAFKGNASAMSSTKAGLDGVSVSATRAAGAQGKAAAAATKAAQSQGQASSSFVKAAESIDRSSGSLNTMARGAGAFGLAAAAGAGMAVRSFANFDQSMSNVAATGDDARQNIDKLREAAIEMGAKTVFSATEAAGGIEELLKAGVSATDVYGGGLAGALDLAAAGQLSVADASSIAATAMTQFGLKGKDVPHIADLLAAGAGKAQGSVTDMGEALKYVGPVANQMGISIEETAGSIALFASQGILGSQAGTSMRGMLASLTSPSKVAAKEMERLGINVYDASGEFVGFRGIAGQLQATMGDLTNAERDEAFGRIFGNEQITTARILYDAGSADVDKWTNAVNDSGYASETAATRLDNLKGDLEALGGSFDSFLINLGESGNGPLRGIIQDATDAVNWLGQLDDTTQATGLAVLGFGAAAGLGAAGVIKVVTATSDVVTSWKDLQRNSPGTANAMGKVGKAAGVAAIALTGLQIVGNIVDDMNGKAVPSLEAVQSSLLGVATGGDSAAAGMDAFFTVTDKQANFYGDEAVNGLADSLERLLSKSSGEKINDWGTTLVDGLGGPAGVAAQLREKFDAVDASLTKMVSSGQADEAAKSFRALRDAAEQRGIGVDKLITLFPEYQATLQAEANDLKVTTLSAQDYADWMGGKVPPAIERARVAAKAAGEAFGEQGKGTDAASVAAAKMRANDEKLTTAQGELHKATEDLNDAVQDTIDKFSILKDGALDVESANNAWEESIDAVEKSTKENGKTLDSHSEKGRANRERIIGMIRALNDKTTADFKNEESTNKSKDATKRLDAAQKVATETMGKGEKQIRAAAKAAGFNKDEVDKMIRMMLKTPEEVRTDINTPGMKDAQKNVDKLGDKVKGLKGKNVSVDVGIKFSPDKLAKSMIKGDYFNNPGAFQTKATGGPIQNISGQGRKKYDTELAMLRVDEHVWTPEEVDAAGGHEAMYRLRKSALKGELRGYKNGGTVARTVNVNTSADQAPLIALGNMTSNLADASGKAGVKYAKEIAAAFAKSAAQKIMESVASGGGSYSAGKAGRYADMRFNSEQLRNAAIIASVGASMGAHAQKIGIATAIVESGLRNLNYGDRDSLGLFQQRAPWGPASARTNPSASAKMFFHGGRGGQRGLDDIRGWKGMSIGRAAQAVQVSAFPGRYQTHADEASAILAGLKSSPSGGGSVGGSGRKVKWKGGTFTEKFVNNLMAAERISRQTFRVTQGGWRPRTSYSGTSHQGDAIDLPWYGSHVVSALRRMNIAAWHRSPSQGPWNHHIHGVPLPSAGTPRGSAIWQGQDYKRGGNGLADGGPVKGWSPNRKADNIPLWGTAGEYMQPVSSVEYYGEKIMDDIRKRKIPREIFNHFGRPMPTIGLANGGPVRPLVVRHVASSNTAGLDPNAIGQAIAANIVIKPAAPSLTIYHPQAEPTSRSIAMAAGYAGVK